MTADARILTSEDLSIPKNRTAKSPTGRVKGLPSGYCEELQNGSLSAEILRYASPLEQAEQIRESPSLKIGIPLVASPVVEFVYSSMNQSEFEANIQNALRKLTREQLEEIAFRIARQLNRERHEELINRIVPENLKG
jgi:hypothetical protein